MDVPEGADLLDAEAQGRPKTSAAWSPYKSKTVGQPFNTQTNNSQTNNSLICFYLSCRCSFSTPLTTFPETDFQTHL